MLVKDVMNKDVRTIKSSANVQEAVKIMTEHRIGSLVIVENKHLIGIITERDILTKVVAQAKSPLTTKVKDVMTSNVTFISPDKHIEDAAELMTKHGIKKLPVVFDHKLVGIVTATDLVAAEPKLLEQIGKLLIFTKRTKAIAG